VLRPFLLLQLGLLVPYCLLGEVTLSYLGLGLPEPYPSLGNMLAGVSTGALSRYWWTWMAPGGVLTATALGANLLVEGLRERYLSPWD
jgi:peptide/nickel transport system permease protein